MNDDGGVVEEVTDRPGGGNWCCVLRKEESKEKSVVYLKLKIEAKVIDSKGKCNFTWFSWEKKGKQVWWHFCPEET